MTPGAASPAPALCLEVWIGAMEGLRVCRPGNESQGIGIGRRRGDEKRGFKNDLVLAEGDGISGFHAELRSEGRRLFLKDLKSTNGTFAAGHQVSGEVEIESGDVFILSNTPVEASFTSSKAAAPGNVPSDEEIAGSPVFVALAQAAKAAAARRGESFADTRHVLEALTVAKDPIVTAALSSRGLTSERIHADFREGNLQKPSLQWVCRFLAAAEEKREKPRSEKSPILSPRARSLFGMAAARLAGYSESEAKRLAAVALFSSFANVAGPVSRWLESAGVQAPAIPAPRRPGGKTTQILRPSATVAMGSDDATVRQKRPAGGDSNDTDVLSSRPGSGAADAGDRSRTKLVRKTAPSTPLVATTGDALLDQRARAIADQLEEAASVYRFSTPEDRRSMMKSVVKNALAAVTPENRARILRQIRDQFPVTISTSAQSSEETRLRARIRELEQRVAELSRRGDRPPDTKREASAETGWRALVAPPGAPPGSAEVETLRAILSFAAKLEKLLLSLVQSITTPGDQTTNFRLSIFRYTLDGVLRSLHEGEVVGLEGIPDYLRELERWQIAILASHHESPRVWFEKLWKKTNPSIIEATTAKSGAWKLGGQAAEWWSRYKEAVRDLNPEVVQDQVLQTANKVALEEYDKLSKRKELRGDKS